MLGIFYITDQIREPIQPKIFHPKIRFNKNIAILFLCCLKPRTREVSIVRHGYNKPSVDLINISNCSLVAYLKMKINESGFLILFACSSFVSLPLFMTFLYGRLLHRFLIRFRCFPNFFVALGDFVSLRACGSLRESC